MSELTGAGIAGVRILEGCGEFGIHLPIEMGVTSHHTEEAGGGIAAIRMGKAYLRCLQSESSPEFSIPNKETVVKVGLADGSALNQVWFAITELVLDPQPELVSFNRTEPLPPEEGGIPSGAARYQGGPCRFRFPLVSA